MCISNEDFEHSEIIQSLRYSWTPPIFTFTTLFSVLFTSMQTLGTGLQAANKSFTATFNGLPMLAMALIGLAFAILHYKDEISGKGGSGKGGTKEATTTTESTNVASEGEITDDEL